MEYQESGTLIVVTYNGGGGDRMDTVAEFLSRTSGMEESRVAYVTMTVDSSGLEDVRLGYYEFTDRPGASVQNIGTVMTITVTRLEDLVPVFNKAVEVYSPQYEADDVADADEIVAAGKAADAGYLEDGRLDGKAMPGEE